MLAIVVFLLFRGLGSVGLTGADEPRYAQIAHEMLAHHDWVTPQLNGEPWLEKPPLYYWGAMVSFEVFGVHDWAARVPSACWALLMVAAIYFQTRRFRRGAEISAVLITATCAGLDIFSHAASTDIGLAACFVVAMLGWQSWFESRDKRWLLQFYFFLGFGVIAKGPIAVGLAGLIIATFLVMRREPRLALRTIWLPGVALFFAVTLPWYFEVQRSNPSFTRVFFLEHNLERFGTNLYHHQHPVWYYVPVLLALLAPWSILAFFAFSTAIRDALSGGVGSEDRNGGYRSFLIVWAIVPLVFFSFSKSKLPGYILPAVPAITILTADYLRQLAKRDLPRAIAWSHGAGCGLLVVITLIVLRRLGAFQHHYAVDPLTIGVALAMLLAIYLIPRKATAALVSLSTLTPLLLIGAIIEAPATALIDSCYSSRSAAVELQQLIENQEPVAVFEVPREVEYGLDFYLDHAISRYERGEIPHRAHIVVLPQSAEPALAGEIAGRAFVHIGSYAPQKLEFYRVATDSPLG